MNKVRSLILSTFLCSAAAPGAEALPDPTRPADYAAESFYVEPVQKEDVDFNLTAVRIDKDTRSVIINGKLLRAGDSVNSAEVQEIHPSHVILDYDGKRMVVRLYRGFSKTTGGTDNKMKITN